MINTREELTAALKEAAEIEHGLMIQYLFAALSFKTHLDEGLSPQQQRQARVWEGNILDIAVSEMGHLGTVQNLLLAIGAAPHFDRPPFPQSTEWYPFPFNLQRFSEDALYDFQIFELPRGVDPPPKPTRTGALMAELKIAPDPLVYSRVGDLYQQISDGFGRIDERELFIGPEAAQATDRWSVPAEALRVSKITGRASAQQAIELIVTDGEGTKVDSPSAHYSRFTSIRRALNDAGNFEASRLVAPNPQTRDLRGAGVGTLIKNAQTLATAELFNAVYALALQMLSQYFSFEGETNLQREALRKGSARMMSTGIRPLAEILTQLPIDDPADPLRAGPTFEQYGEVETSPFVGARWTMLFERFAQVEAEASRLGQDISRIGSVGETISFIRRDVEAAARETV